MMYSEGIGVFRRDGFKTYAETTNDTVYLPLPPSFRPALIIRDQIYSKDVIRNRQNQAATLMELYVLLLQ